MVDGYIRAYFFFFFLLFFFTGSDRYTAVLLLSDSSHSFFVFLDVHSLHEIKGKFSGYINQDCFNFINHNFKDY